MRDLPTRSIGRLLELIGDLIEPGLSAGLVLLAAGGARDADRADHLLPDLNRQGALRRRGIGHMHGEIRRVLLKPAGDLAGGYPEGPRRIGLAAAEIQSVRRGVVAAQLYERLAGTADHRHRHAVALALARIGGGRRDR